ncbi:PREDICTED: enoyl-CoA delta isomerase 1, peroxisomal-like, partial [Amphimedon queenslandica]|uniref:Uncharacterized protein n=1 Tax=Amphimedon queenslandica TaxID=400682 RepID=A0AAN0JUK8_AMPQE
MAVRVFLSCTASKSVISSFFKMSASSSIFRHSSTAASSVTLECKGSVAIIKMCKGENRFTPTFFKEYFKALDDIESNKDIKALITTGDGKFYSNGLDLDNFPSYSPEDVRVLFDVNLNTLFKRMLTFPVITIAAINGHSFAGGGLLALTHDYRLMKRERGWFSLPEVLLKMELTKPLMELAKARL